MDDIAIRVDHVSKSFKLPHEKHGSLKTAFVNILKRKRSFEEQSVLHDVSFDIKKGEFFGVVGRNGSGKSTLLKLLAGVYSPNKGHIQINGKLTPFIELGVGFNPELTGRENIFLNGALLGFSRKEMAAMYDEIVAFAELEKFMDQKLKNYSSGMQVRLAFSVAIQAKSEILVLDEVLAVGDADFQRKCLQYFVHLKKSKQTVVFVSHDMESVKEYCDRAVLLEEGKITAIGRPKDIVPMYMRGFVETADKNANELPLGISKAIKIDSSILDISKVWLEDKQSKVIKSISKTDPYFYVKFNISAKKDTKNIIPGVIVSNEADEFIVASNFKWTDFNKGSSIKKNKTYQIVFKMLNIYEQGSFKISVNVVSEDFTAFYAWKNEARSLYVDKEHVTGAKVNPNCEVEIVEL